MKQIILDSSFILSCVRDKVDFMDDLKFKGYQILIPQQVLYEIVKITQPGQKAHERMNAKIAIDILKKAEYEIIDLENENVDNGIIEYAKKNKTSIATLDLEMKKKYKGEVLSLKGRKKIEQV